ncbi:hypothetical protein B0H19DRAFT_1377700 [Mycena capillaripes]|nr:hypothetical protein B0H19DRAFT_1377700 [Mycena capillaripes]
MAGLTVDDAGYNSDTGPRDNTTVFNFENKEPVRATIVRAPGYNQRALNRQGRAICRIVYAHGWPVVDISKIFNVPPKPIRKTIRNGYVLPDDTSKDYERVEEDFKVKFPKIKTVEVLEIDSDDSGASDGHELNGLSHPMGSTPAAEKHKRTEGAGKQAKSIAPAKGRNHAWSVTPSSSSSDDFQPPSSKPSGSKTNPKKKRTPAPASAPDALVVFLKNVLGLDLSKHQALFKARGFEDVAVLRTIAGLDNRTMQDTLRRLLTGSEQELGGRKGLTELELVMLENAIRKLI